MPNLRNGVINTAKWGSKGGAPCRVQAGKGRPEALGFGEERVVSHAHGVHEDGTGQRDAQSHFIFDGRGCQAFHTLH